MRRSKESYRYRDSRVVKAIFLDNNGNRFFDADPAFDLYLVRRGLKQSILMRFITII